MGSEMCIRDRPMTEQTLNKKTIAITGAAGQLGRHCSARLAYHYGYEVLDIDRKAFSNKERLTEQLKKADIVLHLAGVNRGDDDAVRSGNLEIVEQLIKACILAGNSPHIIYASTIKIHGETIYGQVKKEVGAQLGSYCGEIGAPYTCLLYTSPSPRDGLLSRMPSSA